MLITKSLVIIAGAAQVYAATKTSGDYAPQFSPVFPKMPKATGVVTSYDPNAFPKTTSLSKKQLEGYPEPWSAPPTDTAEVKAIYNKIDWSKVPKAPVRKQTKDGNWVSDTDGPKDPYCWWSDTNCVKPKASYLPPDIYTCENDGEWGLTYDDGPFNLYDDGNAKTENKYAEPALYNFLAKTNQKATLFYIGSNVVTYPAAAKRGLNDGHHICVHTWSHPPMTTQTNKQVVAELYWSLKAIKEATGITTKCWRPPQGDVDDRVRAIAWQMGLRTVIWDEDSNDWQMKAPGGGDLPTSTVDGYFEKWINNYKSGKDKKGHIVLEHELNHATVNMSMFWMPKLQETFTVLPGLACNGISQPYWEENFVYPTGPTSKPNKPSPSNPSNCDSGSYGLGNGDGYNGACCKDQSDCQDDCISGKCDGPKNPNSSSSSSNYDCISGKCDGPSKPDSSSSCKSGYRGKKKGNGPKNACCSTQWDCNDDCVQGRCT
ncbi:uncharacterized protein B0P05DRAFT_490636 [Gilbertella persicaria]|uniref:uncharacterized protein n=1 Tax=Gilbertella persicaria TaxID=101096 RepID=UPI00221EEBD7|nr:uncharacterized protein B0P05DRAFT_490636 [Gilbertella persicaria]KAI8080261.1 hypothetical protein B0P05DRAFT_490636 [Gilbertella persicaria]